ncbi:MAG: hypothetical protein HC851_24680 [Acaryochloris sp. RU_4_1]|nr:hypothetical protein [Acaryochloris sp. RU_4_1]
MLKRIKVEKIDFDEAEDDGFVYGKDLSRRLYNSVYIELGQEKPYSPASSDDSRTDYRFFRNCNVHYAESDQQADLENFNESIWDVSVVIYN